MNKKDFIAGLRGITDITLSNLRQLSGKTLFDYDLTSFLKFCKEHDINYLVNDEIFLKKVKPVPYVLFYKGNIQLLNKKIIWIVGSRKINNFIKVWLEKFFDFLKDKDVVIVSGLADGTDTYAHKLSLKYGIPTIAVLWFGFKQGLNSYQRELINKISDRGLVLSEFKLDQSGTKWTFPQRNRIIAGLSDFMFVPQAAEKSWTLITVNKAIEYWIEVYSLFSDYKDEFGKWTNHLIAKWVINWIYDFDSFLEEISNKFNLKTLSLSTTSDTIKLSEEESHIINSIKKWNTTLELLQIDTGIPIDRLLNLLSLLELNWIIYSDLNQYFVK